MASNEDTSWWGYSSANGPSRWSERFPLCQGDRQSPIDIRQSKYDPLLRRRPLKFNYTGSPTSVSNNGRTFSVNYANAVDNDSCITGGPLGDEKYFLHHFHMHWGTAEADGSEHAVNGRLYKAELHVVHVREKHNMVLSKALEDPRGLAVIGAFYDVGDEHNSQFKPLERLLEKVVYRGQSANLSDVSLNPLTLLPDIEKSHYWTYSGSLTTPPCCECISFVIFAEPVLFHKDQLASLSKLSSGPHGQDYPAIACNCRPVQSLNGRDVYCSTRLKEFVN